MKNKLLSANDLTARSTLWQSKSCDQATDHDVLHGSVPERQPESSCRCAVRLFRAQELKSTRGGEEFLLLADRYSFPCLFSFR